MLDRINTHVAVLKVDAQLQVAWRDARWDGEWASLRVAGAGHKATELVVPAIARVLGHGTKV